MFSLLLALATVATAGNSKKKKKEEEKQGYQFTELKRLPATSVKSQDRAGTCWSWSTISFLESEMMRLGKDSVSLAPMYIVWNTYNEKADKYVRMHGCMNFAQGGASADVNWAIKNYGIVPLEIYSGLNYGENIHAHAELDGVLGAYLKVIVSNPNKKLSTAWKKGFDGILDAYLGAKPEKIHLPGKRIYSYVFLPVYRIKYGRLYQSDFFHPSSFLYKICAGSSRQLDWGRKLQPSVG